MVSISRLRLIQPNGPALFYGAFIGGPFFHSFQEGFHSRNIHSPDVCPDERNLHREAHHDIYTSVGGERTNIPAPVNSSLANHVLFASSFSMNSICILNCGP